MTTIFLCRCKKAHEHFEADLASTSAPNPLEDVLAVHSSRIPPSAPCDGIVTHTDSCEFHSTKGEDSHNVKLMPNRAAESEGIVKDEEGCTDEDSNTHTSGIVCDVISEKVTEKQQIILNNVGFFDDEQEDFHQYLGAFEFA